MSRKVFVVGPHLPAGGARMAHWVARIASNQFGYELVCVPIGDDFSGYGMFGDPEIETIARLEDVCDQASTEDLLICNPSFSEYGLGQRFPGRSICYAQGFSTYTLLDHFDHYVSVSTAVQAHMLNIYSIETVVIPPFAPLPADEEQICWKQKKDTVLVSSKGTSALPNRYLEDALTAIRTSFPSFTIETISTFRHPQSNIHRKMAESKFLLSFSTQEGFGLMPLEAMSRGCVVMGFDGVGGRDFMEPPINCATHTWMEAPEISRRIIDTITDDVSCGLISDAARQVAHAYTFRIFEDRWQKLLSTILT